MVSQVVSAAFFCPRTRPPPDRYVDEMRIFLRQNRYGASLLAHVSDLESTWALLSDSRNDIASIPEGDYLTQVLVDWSSDGPSNSVCSAKSSIIALPLLMILQLGQYFRYLEAYGVRHAEFLQQVRQNGGIHGYCGGCAAVLAIACAENEEEVVRLAGVLLRVVLGIGAAMEAADHQASQHSATIAVRLKNEEQGEVLTRKFPGVSRCYHTTIFLGLLTRSQTYISAVTEPKSISIVGPSHSLTLLTNHAREIGLPVHVTDITGRSHNPENQDLAQQIISLLEKHTRFQLPKRIRPRVLVRSNLDGHVLPTDSIVADMITMMLTSRCEWYTLLSRVAEDMKASSRQSHMIAVFGMDNCVPMSPFHKNQVIVSKFEARSLSMVSPELVSPSSSTLNSHPSPATAVAIVGASCRLPGANNMEELWQLISEGRDCHQEVPLDRFDMRKNLRETQGDASKRSEKFYGNFVDDVKGFDGAFFGVNHREAANMDPQQRLLLELSHEALEDSGYIKQHIREAGDSVGCFIGASFVEYLDNTNSHAPTAYTSTGTIRGFLCGRISYHYGWTGPSEVIDTACSSSLVAINRACIALQTGECTMALTGGINLITGINNFLDLHKARFLSPTGQCKAFDASADGYCRSEGGGLVVLKLLKHAIQAEDNILGIIPSIGTNQGGLSSSLTVPSVTSLQSLYKILLKQANLQPSDVSYVEAHATGTQAGDPIEMESIRAVFGDPNRTSTPLPIGSIKGNIGHCEAAAGVAGLLKVISMLQHGKIPAQANFKNLNPNIPDLRSHNLMIPRENLSWKGEHRIALVNSYGAAGSNAALLCCEAPAYQERLQNPIDITFPLLMSADSIRSLKLQAQVLGQYLEGLLPSASLRDIAFTLNHRRRIRKFCFSTTATSSEKPAAINLDAIDSQAYEYPTNPKPVVLVFGGQNGKSVRLSCSWLETYPAFRSHVDSCDRELKSLGFPSLYPAIFSDGELPTAVLVQCGMFAVQYACASCWIDGGLNVEAIVGHSLGEIVALVVSKSLSLADGMRLVASRASLIDTKWGEDKGLMLAVHTSSSEAVRLINIVQANSSNAHLQIACYNTPQSTVIAGSSASIQQAEETLRRETSFLGIKHQRLSTTHAFHSDLTLPLLADVEKLAEGLSWYEPIFPFEYCTPTARSSIRRWKAEMHLREPVFFSDAIHRIEKRLGACNWLEAGFNSPMLSLAKRACSSPEMHSFFPLDTRSAETPSGLISNVISRLWKHGISLRNWAHLGQNPRYAWLPPHQFDRVSHWVENIDRAAEATRKLAESFVTPPPTPEPETKWLVTRQGTENSKSILFDIDGQCDRFRNIVAGHAVLGQSLCPASLYMECATMACRLLGSTASELNVQFDNLEFLSPLGIDLQRKIKLALDQSEDCDMAWDFIVRSTMLNHFGKFSNHCKGKISFTKTADFARWSRLLHGRIERLKHSETAEKIFSKRVYGLFSRVVDYAAFLKGIHSIHIDNREALATIALPEKGQPGRHETTVWQRCDTALVDAFISVSGLLLNSSDTVSEDQVMVATGVEQVVLDQACAMDSPARWTVYTMFTNVDESKALSDIFVYSSQGTMLATFSGVRFAKVHMSKLRKTLSSANPESVGCTVAETIKSASSSLDTASVAVNTPATDESDQEVQESERSIASSVNMEMARSLIAGFTGLEVPRISTKMLLVDIGIDSLSSIELSAEIQAQLKVSIPPDDLCNMTVVDVFQRVSGPTPEFTAFVATEKKEIGEEITTETTDSSQNCRYQITFDDPFQALNEAQSRFEIAAEEHGFANYWDEPHRVQNDLLIAYILEALSELGINLGSMSASTPVPPLPNIPKHSRLVSRLWQILQAEGIVVRQDDIIVRGQKSLETQTSCELYDVFTSQLPQYRPEADLMRLTGPKLAQCLVGQQNPVSLMFGHPSAAKIMENYYHNSPMLSSLTDTLVEYVMQLCKRVPTNSGEPIRILEVGAGTGGTTTRLVDALTAAGVDYQYTFTDISVMIVSQARERFGNRPWINFHSFDLEKEIGDEFRNRFDIVIGTNCVHATKDRVRSCQRLRDILTDNGLLILSEVTRVIDWYDICFGLLEGWWYASNGTEYPLQPSHVWLEAFQSAGFKSTCCSQGTSTESTTQQLLIGCKHAQQPTRPNAIPYHMEVIEYKEVEGVRIQADVYVPYAVETAPMPLALMIHGGGHMSLSRKAIRPAQVNHLLAIGFLPVSLDYRLCPEINLIDGAMADVRDGYWWAKNNLPSELLKTGIVVDSDRVVVVGWSTGGHLAMSLGWTTKEAGMPAPSAILSFYAPVDFESDGQSPPFFPSPK
jgi:acyl transferase domain-containing protein/acyl carrier protein/SAM-dependent methyltransferase